MNNIEVTVTKLTGKSLLDKSVGFTVGSEINCKNIGGFYRSEHSPSRTQLFWVEMRNIPSFVAMHLARHKIGFEPFIKSLRDDRGGTGKEDRNSPVDMAILLNAQALIHVCRKRLCKLHPHEETRAVVERIKGEIKGIDKELYDNLVPDCIYRGGCKEFKACGYYKNYVRHELLEKSEWNVIEVDTVLQQLIKIGLVR